MKDDLTDKVLGIGFVILLAVGVFGGTTLFIDVVFGILDAVK
jgi:hypothetical protein